MKKKICFLLVMLLAFTVIPVGAKTNNFYADNNLALNKDLDRTAFIAGNNVEVTSTIDGIGFMAGQHLNLQSKQDYLFVGGNTINLNNATAKDTFLAGSNITINNSRIRDLYAAAGSIEINSPVEGNAFIGGDSVTINTVINGDVYIAADTINIGKEATIKGTLKYPEEATVDISKEATIKEVKTYKGDTSTEEDSFLETLKDKIYAFIAMIIMGIILLALNNKAFVKISKKKKDAGSIFKDIGIGFAFLIAVPIVCIILLITVIGIPLSIISLLLYGIMIYLSLIPTAYFLGKWLLNDKIKNEYLILTVSLLTIYILKLIPVIGGLVTFLGICLGLGLFTSLVKENIKK